MHDPHVIRLKKRGDDTPMPAPISLRPVQAVLAPERPSDLPAPKHRKKQSRARRPFLLVGSMVAILLGIYFFPRHHDVPAPLPSQSASAEASADASDEIAPQDSDIVARVSKLMLLPSETPTIAIVHDMAPLRDQAFFAHAKLGDYVLMYPKAGRAVLFDPDADKVIESGPITGQ